MAVRPLPLLLFLLLIPGMVSADPPAPQEQPEEAPQQVRQKPDSRLIRDAFQSQFTNDQLGKFGKPPTIAQLVERMSPEQRQGARVKLGELERNAKTPATRRCVRPV